MENPLDPPPLPPPEPIASERYYGHASAGQPAAPPRVQPHSRPTAAAPTVPVTERLDRCYWALKPPGQQPWGEFAMGGAVGVAGLALGVVAAVAGVAFVASLADPVTAVGIVVGSVGGGLAAAFFAFFFALMAAFVATPLAAIAVGLCGVRLRSTTLGCFVGGVVGLAACSIPVLLNPALDAPLEVAGWLVLLVTPVTFAGQLGGGWFPISDAIVPLSMKWPTPEGGANEGRFSLRQLFGATTAACLVFGALQAAGAFTPAVLVFVMGWLVVQLGTGLLAVRFVDWRWRRKICKASGRI